MSVPVPARSYFVGAMELAEPALRALLANYGSPSPFWDFRPDANRFTMREAVAHLADWNDVFHDRLSRTLKEIHPVLPNRDEDQMAIDNDYAHADPWETMERFAVTRRKLVDFVRGLAPEDWDRTANRKRIGDITMSDQIGLVSAHDAYHLRQAIEYVTKFREWMAGSVPPHPS